jgi:glutaconyl-CoA/methylmalonyl-CoA decarboxylase subunit delta
MDDLVFGLRTTVLGMGIVFAVLAIVWLLLATLGPLDARDAARLAATAPAEPAMAGRPSVRIEGGEAGLDPRLVAAVTVAVLRHEEARRLQAAPAMRSSWPGSLLFASRWVAAGRTRQGQAWRRRR